MPEEEKPRPGDLEEEEVHYEDPMASLFDGEERRDIEPHEIQAAPAKPKKRARKPPAIDPLTGEPVPPPKMRRAKAAPEGGNVA